METMKGVINGMSADQKRCKIGDEWYSVFALPSMGGAQVGDEVKFAYVEKESGGKVYNNIKGSVTVIGKGGGASASASGGSAPKSYGESPERNMSIIRQNALTNATAFYNANLKEQTNPNDIDEAIATIITVAEAFSQFSSGEYADKKRKLEQEEMAIAEQHLARVSRAVVGTGH